MPMIACEHCDALNKSDAEVCVACGASLKPAATPSAAPPPLPPAGGPAPAPVPGSSARKARPPAAVRGAARVASPSRKYGVKSRAERIAEEGVSERSRTRRRERSQKGNSSALRIILVTVGALFLVGGGVWAMTLPPAIEDAAAEFEALWQAGDADAMIDRIDANSARTSSKLKAKLTKRGWLADMPALGTCEIERRDRRAATSWDCAGDKLRVAWLLTENDRWRITRFAWPEWQPPSVDSGVAAFRAAWGAPGCDGLQELTRIPDGRLANSLETLLERREWHERRPVLEEARIGGMRADGSCSVYFTVAGGEMKVGFDYWHPRWTLSGLRLPE
jgi:hypothetical protein